MEYLFKKDDLLNLITASADSNYIAVNINFLHGAAGGEFKAEIKATAVTINAGAQASSASAPAAVNGCPNPPGCPGESGNTNT